MGKNDWDPSFRIISRIITVDKTNFPDFQSFVNLLLFPSHKLDRSPFSVPMHPWPRTHDDLFLQRSHTGVLLFCLPRSPNETRWVPTSKTQAIIRYIYIYNIYIIYIYMYVYILYIYILLYEIMIFNYIVYI